MKNHHIDIIGAGIGGLTTAIALQQKGQQVRIFEQSKALIPVGAGILLTNNAMQVFQKLGLQKDLENKGFPLKALNIKTANLAPLLKIDLEFFKHKYKVGSIAIARSDLQQILLDHLDIKSLHLDHQLDSIQTFDTAHRLNFSNGQSLSSRVILGADGIHSKVREVILGKNTLRIAHQFCWRGIANMSLPDHFQNELQELWGNSDRFGFVNLGVDKVYWYALKSYDERTESDLWDATNIAKYFVKYTPLVNQIINATPENYLHKTIISDLPPLKSWTYKNIALIGDAAHPATPNMGQGACQAIEDAYTIAACIEKQDIISAFATYQKLRKPKAQFVVNQSWKLGKMAHYSNPVSILLRNQLMKTMPRSINRKQNEKLFQLPQV